MLAPAPRANTLIALNDPSAYLVEGMADAPDISIAFRTYQDAGRMINLADWFNAFRQQAEAGKRMGELNEQSTASKSNGKRQASTRSDDGVDSSELSELDDEGEREEAAHSNKRRKANDKRSEKDLAAWNRPDLLRTRFALAVHELGAMGFLKRTRRKPEHVMKLIFDLAPSKQ
jgi:origin recognition complex subunit 3